MPRKYVNLKPPLGGLNEKGGYQKQPPFTTPDCSNVWPYDSVDGRARIGSRPGIKFSSTDMGFRVNMLTSLTYIDEDYAMREVLVAAEKGQLFTSPDGVTFTRKATGSIRRVHKTNELMAVGRNGKLYIADWELPGASGTDGTLDEDGTTFNTTTGYSNWNATLDNGVQLNANDYVVAIDSTGAGSNANIGIYEIASFGSGDITLAKAASREEEEGIVFRVLRAPKVYDPVADTLVLMTTSTNGADYTASPAASGSDGTLDSAGTAFDSATYSNWTSSPTTALDDTTPVLIIANVGADGDAVIGLYDIATVASGNLTLSSAANRGGSASTGIKFRVQPKVYTSVPCGHPIIALYRDRIFFSGGADAPHNWHASRSGDPLEWDVGRNDPLRALSGQGNNAGALGTPVRALVPHADQCLLIGCVDSLWIMRGDPAFGGTIENLSYEIGMVDKNAWAQTPDNATVFLSNDGVYVCPTGCGARSVNLYSRDVAPEKLLNTPASSRVFMSYDMRYRGVVMWVVTNGGQTSGTAGYLISWSGDNKGLWPMTLSVAAHEPLSIATFSPSGGSASGSHGNVFWGTTLGKVAHFSADVSQDDATDITSYCTLGPVDLGGKVGSAKVCEIQGITDSSSGDVDWELLVGNSFEECVSDTPRFTGSWNKAGRNRTSRPRERGSVVAVKVKNGAANEEWALEQVVLGVEPGGRVRESHT